MNKKTLLCGLALFCATAFAAQADSTLLRDQLASANTGFAFKLLEEISREQSDTNIFISPYSVSSVLQMVGNGAGGKTKDEIQRVLGLSNIDSNSQNEAYFDLDRLIHGGNTNSILHSANALWYRQGFAVKPGFVACNQQYFQATVTGLDFDNPSSIDIMNGWVNEKTHGRIPSIVSGPIDPNTRMYLANAVYFKGKWLDPFEAKDTKERPFHLPGGRQKNVPLMVRGGSFSYRHGSGYQAVRLPYVDPGLAMYVLLPDTDSSLKKLLSTLNGDNWQRVTLPGFSQRSGRLELPRFKLEYGVDLNAPLQALGIKKAFDIEKADFRALGNEPTFISEALQKAFVEVNEEGTEAAAATIVSFNTRGMDLDPPKPFEMIVDHPFLFIIEDGASHSILFMGAIFDPPSPK
jgi:serine protease inhibitor